MNVIVWAKAFLCLKVGYVDQSWHKALMLYTLALSIQQGDSENLERIQMFFFLRYMLYTPMHETLRWPACMSRTAQGRC